MSAAESGLTFADGEATDEAVGAVPCAAGDEQRCRRGPKRGAGAVTLSLAHAVGAACPGCWLTAWDPAPGRRRLAVCWQDVIPAALPGVSSGEIDSSNILGGPF